MRNAKHSEPIGWCGRWRVAGATLTADGIGDDADRAGDPGPYTAPVPAFSGLSKAWVEAEAARPDGWELLGVAKGPRELDPRIASAEWVAWARPVSEQANYRAYAIVQGRGESAQSALSGLARALRDIGGR